MSEDYEKIESSPVSDNNVPEVDPSASLESLNYDCLIEILQRLRLQEVITLRQVSSALNEAVCDYLNTYKNLQVVLSTFSYTTRPHEVEYQSVKKPSEMDCYDYYTNHQNDTIRVPACFPLKKFILVNGTAKAELLIEFIRKYMPNTTKLAIFFDDTVYLRHIVKILKSVPMLGVLFMNSTDWGYDFLQNDRVLSDKIVDIIIHHKNVRILHYFPHSLEPLMNSHENIYAKLKRETLTKLRRLYRALTRMTNEE